MAPSKSQADADDFVNIWSDADNASENPQSEFYNQWVEHSSAKQPIPAVIGANALRKLHPGHSVVLTQGYGMNLLGFPAASVAPFEKTKLVTNLFFVPLSRSLGTPGVLVDQVEYGAFDVSWNQFKLIVYSLTYPVAYGNVSQYFIVHQGPEEISRLFLLSAGAWADSLHDEIWVYNQGFWRKDHALWQEIQKADWKDVILKEEFKKALQKDIYGFFASEAIYKDLAIPWKRGLIMYGPPGNGKTISLKTIMKTCGEKGFAPLYVKSFKSYKGEEGSMADVFDKARQLAPCVIILEDLDSLINDDNRSFFLNQMDGLAGNDGLLVIGTTNHFERLDPGLSTRPSRFDRKYKFDDPDEEERKLYVQYWQQKLVPNKDIQFPDRLVNKVARLTDRFSFAYLKEAFVSSLVTFAGRAEGDTVTFECLLLAQVDILKKQLDKQLHDTRSSIRADPVSIDHSARYGAYHSYSSAPTRPPRPDSSKEYDVHVLLDALSDSTVRSDTGRARFYRTSADAGSTSPGSERQDSRNFRDLLDNLSDSLSLDQNSRRSYKAASPGEADERSHCRASQDNQQRIRNLMDTISAETAQAERLYSTVPFNVNVNSSPVGWPSRAEPGGSSNQQLSAGPAGYPLSNPSIWK